MMPDVVGWLLQSEEPWTRYRTLLDLMGLPEAAPEVQAERDDMLAHPMVRQLVAETAEWGSRPLKRHNDASHHIYKLSTLADFGLRHDDPGMSESLTGLLGHQDDDGPFQTVLNIHPRFGGSGDDTWSWIMCDAPTLLHSLLAMGLGTDERVLKAADHLEGIISENGWHCGGGPEIGRFRGPGRKGDPCPIANVYALKALAQNPDRLDSIATRTGAEMLLGHWERQRERKLYLFGIGTDFRKLKYPFVWYDILHVVDVLSRFPFLHGDPRLLEMVKTIHSQADGNGRYTATSMYRAWKAWSFADKKTPSPWLTFLVERVRARVHGSEGATST
jgi:hypothetical protein